MAFSATEIFTVLGLVAGSFIATNMDNLLILVMLLGANAKRRSAVLLGFLCSTIVVICVSALGVALEGAIGPGLIGYLGIVPLLLGFHMLYQSWSDGQAAGEEFESLTNSTEPKIWWSTFILMFSNSGDSVAVFLPLLAESGRSALLLIVCSYLTMAAQMMPMPHRRLRRHRLANISSARNR